MPLTYDVPLLTIYRTGQVKLSDLARRTLARPLAGAAAAVVLVAPSAIGGRWLLLPVPADTAGALALYEDRGQQRFRAYALAVAVFALLPDTQKHTHLTLAAAPGGFWLVPSADVPDKFQPAAQAA